MVLSSAHRRSKSYSNGFNDVTGAASRTSTNNQMNGSGSNGSSSGAKVIRVPISTFPPTAMVYSVSEEPSNHNQEQQFSPDYVSSAIMAKVLEERSKERQLRNGSKIAKCSNCRNRRAIVNYFDQTTQTPNGLVNCDEYSAVDLNYSQQARLSFDSTGSSPKSTSSWPATFAINGGVHQQLVNPVASHHYPANNYFAKVPVNSKSNETLII